MMKQTAPLSLSHENELLIKVSLNSYVVGILYEFLKLGI